MMLSFYRIWLRRVNKEEIKKNKNEQFIGGFSPFKDGDLKEDNLKSCLECLAQLHGTGIAYKLSLGGKKELLAQFPDMQEQAQIRVYFPLDTF